MFGFECECCEDQCGFETWSDTARGLSETESKSESESEDRCLGLKSALYEDR